MEEDGLVIYVRVSSLDDHLSWGLRHRYYGLSLWDSIICLQQLDENCSLKAQIS